MKKPIRHFLSLISGLILYCQPSLSQSLTIVQAEAILNDLVVPYAESPSAWFREVDTLRKHDYSISLHFDQGQQTSTLVNKHGYFGFTHISNGDKIVLSSSVHKTRVSNGPWVYKDVWTRIYMETRDLAVYDKWVNEISSMGGTRNQGQPFEFSFLQNVSLPGQDPYQYYIKVCKTNYQYAPPNFKGTSPPSFSVELSYCLKPQSPPPV